jgi:hypothetical protein
LCEKWAMARKKKELEQRRRHRPASSFGRSAATLDDKLKELRDLKQQGAETFDVWEIVGDILEHDPPLWQGRYRRGGFIAAELSKFIGAAGRRNVLVAGAFRPKDRDIRHVARRDRSTSRKSGMTEPRALDLPRVVVEVPDSHVPSARRSLTMDEVTKARKALGKKKAAPRAARGGRPQSVVRRKTLAGLRWRSQARRSRASARGSSGARRGALELELPEDRADLGRSARR